MPCSGHCRHPVARRRERASRGCAVSDSGGHAAFNAQLIAEDVLVLDRESIWLMKEDVLLPAHYPGFGKYRRKPVAQALSSKPRCFPDPEATG